MTETFTHNHLLQSIYGELESCEDFKLKNEILKNPELAAEYRELRKSVSLLNSNTFSPKESTAKRILQKSKDEETELA